VETRPDTQPPSAEVDTAGKIAECERKLAQYRAALDAGASPATVAAWIAETEAETASYALRSPKRRPRMTQQEIKFIVTSSQTWPEY
jgi:site-specific DNA recombinase